MIFQVKLKINGMIGFLVAIFLKDVCPWNSKLKPHNEEAFQISDLLQNMKKSDWKEMEKSSFKELFKSSPIERTKFEGLKRNIDFLM